MLTKKRKKKNATYIERKAGRPASKRTANNTFLTAISIKSISTPQGLSKTSFTQRTKNLFH